MDLVLVGAASGATAGLAGRALLARLRRGTEVHSGWLAGTVAVLWATLAWRVARGHLPPWWLPVPLALTWFATLLTVVDMRHRRLPDALTLTAYPAMAAAAALAAYLGDDWSIAVRAAVGGLLFATLHAAIHVVRPQSLGAGDVKLSGSVGAALAASGWPTLALASVVAALATLLLAALTRPPRGDGIPYGPGLLTAACLFTTFPTTAITPP